MEKRKHLSPQQKVIILREHLENQVPLSQLSERYQVHVNVLYKWKKQLFVPEGSLRERSSWNIQSETDSRVTGTEGKDCSVGESIKGQGSVDFRVGRREHIFKKKSEWINLNGRWVEPEIRDKVVDYIEKMSQITEIDKRTIISWVGIQPGKYYDWKKRFRTSNHHNGQIPKSHCLPVRQGSCLRNTKTY